MKPLQKNRPPRNGTAPLLVLVLLSQGLLFVSTFGLWLAMSRLSKRQVAFVQTTNGDAFAIHSIASGDRTPETIRRFVTSTCYLLFNWSGELTAANGTKEPDKGVEIDADGKRVKVPSAALYASYAVSSELQTALLQKIAQIVPTGLYQGSATAVLTLDHVSEPKQVGTGAWQVDVVGAHHLVKRSPPGRLIPFRKRMVVEAVTVPVVPQGETPLEHSIYRVRQSGLQITSMTELTGG